MSIDMTQGLMRHDRWNIKTLPVWLRAGLIAYLLGSVLLVSIHQHPGGVAAHDCAICTAAHMPLVTPTVSAQAPRPVVSVSPLPVASERSAVPGFTRTAPSRAPPQA
jgi:hypothetical protein